MPNPIFSFAGAALDGYRLLVAEDDAIVAESACATLRAAGGEVLGPVASVHDATRIVSSEPIDCAVVDLSLSDGQAIPLLDLLLSEAVPIVLATGAAREDIPRAYWRLLRVEKPYDARMLVDCALAALGDGVRAPAQISPASGLDGSA